MIGKSPDQTSGIYPTVTERFHRDEPRVSIVGSKD